MHFKKTYKDNAATGSADKAVDEDGRASPREKGGASKKAKQVAWPAQAQKLKTDYEQLMSQSNLILGSIKENPAWSQFGGGGGEHTLKQAMAAVEEEIGTGDFNRQFMMETLASLKKKLGAKNLDASCKNFVLSVQGPLSSLSVNTRKITMQFEVGQAAERQK